MSPFQTVRLLVSMVRLVRDPSRLGDVFELVESMRDPATFGPIVDAFRQSEEGTRALRERTRVGRVSLGELRTMPEGSLGRAFAEHLDRNGLDPSALPTLEARDDFDYVNAHLYETHDIWHAVTGFGADVAGELGLQAFYLAHFPARLGAVILGIGMLNTFFYAFDDRTARFDEITRGWIMGKSARSLLGVDWKTLWSTPLSEVRARYAIDPQPLARTHAVTRPLAEQRQHAAA